MAEQCKVFEVKSPDGNIVVYLGALDFVDHTTHADPVEGVVAVRVASLNTRRVFARITCAIRYGCDAMELLGLNFDEHLLMAAGQVYPCPAEDRDSPSVLQLQLLQQLGPEAVPFRLQLPRHALSTVSLGATGPAAAEDGRPCGVAYHLAVFPALSQTERLHHRSAAMVGIRRLQGVPGEGVATTQPSVSICRRFLLSTGQLRLDTSLDRAVYTRGDRLALQVCIWNDSGRTVRRIKASLLQTVHVRLYTNSVHRTTIDTVQLGSSCSVFPGEHAQRILHLRPSVTRCQKSLRNLALNGDLEEQPDGLASTTLPGRLDKKLFGISIQYSVKTKLYLSSFGGRMTAEIPFVMTHLKSDVRRLAGDSSGRGPTGSQEPPVRCRSCPSRLDCAATSDQQAERQLAEALLLRGCPLRQSRAQPSAAVRCHAGLVPVGRPRCRQFRQLEELWPEHQHQRGAWQEGRAGARLRRSSSLPSGVGESATAAGPLRSAAVAAENFHGMAY